MFTGMTLAELEALRTSVREQYQKLILGQATSQLRYGEMGQVFHPANPDHCEKFLAEINTAIDRLNGTGGALFPVTG